MRLTYRCAHNCLGGNCKIHYQTQTFIKLHIFYKERFFSTQPQHWLTFLLIEL